MPALSNKARSSSLDFSNPELASRISFIGRLRAPGICPERKPGRGSGACPSKRALARASKICGAVPASTRPLSWSISITLASDAGDGVKVVADKGAVSSPEVVGPPASSHACQPPSSTATSSCPNIRSIHHARADERNTDRS